MRKVSIELYCACVLWVPRSKGVSELPAGIWDNVIDHLWDDHDAFRASCTGSTYRNFITASRCHYFYPVSLES